MLRFACFPPVCLYQVGPIRVFEFASDKLMTTLSIKEYQNLVVVIAAKKIRFEMILAVKVNAIHTNGESKRGTKFLTLQSITSAFRRQEAAISAMEYEPRAPVGAASRARLSLSMIIPTQAQVTVVIHG